MRRAWSWVALSLVLSLAPTAAGVETVVDDQACVDAAGCVPSTICVPGALCQATPCDPANTCTARFGVEDSCRVNLTIDGETCGTGAHVGGAFGGRNIAIPGTYVLPGRPIPDSSIDVPVTRLEAEADLTRGFVHGLHLPNDWISHGARVRATLLGMDLGETGASVYQSSIDVPAEEDEQGNASDNETHTFTRGIATIRHESNAAQVGASGGFLLLDGALESCFARAGPRDDVETTCADILALVDV